MTLKSLIMPNVITYLYFKMLQEIVFYQHLGGLKILSQEKRKIKSDKQKQ